MYYLNTPRGYIFCTFSARRARDLLSGEFMSDNEAGRMARYRTGGDELMSCGNPCLLEGDEISGAKQMRRAIGIRGAGVWACGCGRIERFSPVDIFGKVRRWFPRIERFFFSRWRIGCEAERFSPRSPDAIVLLRKDSPGAVPFDNEESVSPVRIYESDVGFHSHLASNGRNQHLIDIGRTGACRRDRFMPVTIGIYDTEVRLVSLFARVFA